MPSMSRNSPVLTAFVLWLLAASASAQDKPELSRRSDDDTAAVRGSIRGRVLMADGSYVSTNVKVTLQTVRETIATIYTDSQGQFEFLELNPGNYQLEIDPTDREHFEPSNEGVQVFKGTPSIVTLTLKPSESRKPKTATGTVSLTELAANVPSSARKEFEKANQASQRGLVDEAVSHLRKAIAIAPSFVMAHNDLGVNLLSQGKLVEAAEALRRAVNLDDKAFNPALNYGIVLVHLHQFSEANESLSRALKLNPNSAAAHLYVGLAVNGLGSSEDAARELKTAYEMGGAEFAVALFHLGEIYMTGGNKNLSLRYLESYLAIAPNGKNADQVRRMIAMLR